MMKIPVKKRLITFMAFIVTIFLLAISQHAIAARTATTTGSVDLNTTAQARNKTPGKKTSSAVNKTHATKNPTALAGTTLITYTYDNNGNLIGKTKAAGP